MTQGTDDKNLGVFIREQQKDLSVRKSIKVKLPIRQHIKLHALKLFTENNISETVEAALDSYFETMGSGEQAAAESMALAADGLGAGEVPASGVTGAPAQGE